MAKHPTCKEARSKSNSGPTSGPAVGRRTLIGAGLTGIGAFALSGCGKANGASAIRESTTAKTLKWKAQSAHPVVGADYEPFVKFCRTVSELSQGQLEIEPHGPGEVVPVRDMTDALRLGKLDFVVTFPGYADFIPGTSFLTSYPLGLDHPDHWETWYYELGGLGLARRMFAPQGIHFLAPIQHDSNLIHSRVPIRSIDDFTGVKIRMPGGLIADVFDTIGAKTVFLTGDLVYHTLQSGAIDAADFSGPATNFNLGLADVAKYIIMGPPSTPCIHQPVDLHCALVGLEQWSALPNHLQQVLEYATRRFSWDDYACVQRKNLQAWEGFREKGTEIIRLSTSDIDRLRNAAIPIWFKWGRKDPLAAEALASQIAYMKSPAIGYLNDAMLVDKRGERLSL